jgi:hypothetical protein
VAADDSVQIGRREANMEFAAQGMNLALLIMLIFVILTLVNQA